MEMLLIRHGETPGNAARRYVGVLDQPLSDAGRIQAREAGVFEDQELVYVSTMRRARETAAIMDGAVVPAFDPEAPASVIHPEEAFSPAAVPQFEFFGNQPAGFETILDLAVGSGGTAP
jgi:phosphohistidine phosphatase SixA